MTAVARARDLLCLLGTERLPVRPVGQWRTRNFVFGPRTRDAFVPGLRARARILWHFAPAPMPNCNIIRRLQLSAGLGSHRPAGRGGGLASAALPILDDVTTSPASRRLAYARPALAPKCQLVLARTPKGRRFTPLVFARIPQPEFDPLHHWIVAPFVKIALSYENASLRCLRRREIGAPGLHYSRRFYRVRVSGPSDGRPRASPRTFVNNAD